MVDPVVIYDSAAWTGRGAWAGSPIDVARRAIRARLYPAFDCADCIGMREHGCECAYYGATAPGEGPSDLLLVLREIARRLWGIDG